jgi:glutaredoxin
MKTPDNLKKYGGKLEQDIHYIVKGDKIVFPSTLENPYKTKPYLSKVLKTIMDNAGVNFQIVDVEQDSESPKTVEKSKAEEVPPLTVTSDSKDKVEKARSAFQKEIGEVPTAKYEIETVETEAGRQYKLVVTGISKDQRQKLLVKKSTLKEEQEFDFDLYRMKKLAGL